METKPIKSESIAATTRQPVPLTALLLCIGLPTILVLISCAYIYYRNGYIDAAQWPTVAACWIGLTFLGGLYYLTSLRIERFLAIHKPFSDTPPPSKPRGAEKNA